MDSAGGRASERNARCQIGMQNPERLDRSAISHDWTNHSVTTIFALAKAIAMLDPRVPASNAAIPWTDDVIDADVFAKNLAAPAVVISRDPYDLETGIPKLGQRGERAKTSAWNHRLPFEPEVEQIAIDDERSRRTVEIAQKTDERAFYLRTGDAEVRIGYDVAGGSEHG